MGTLYFSILPADLNRLFLIYLPKEMSLILNDIPQFTPYITTDQIKFSCHEWISYAAKGGHLEILKWAKPSGCQGVCKISINIF